MAATSVLESEAVPETPAGEPEPVVLRDGSSAWLRSARPSDIDALVALFDRASRQSLLFRFFTPLRRVDHSLIEQLATADGAERMAYVATRGLGAEEHIIAVGNYSRLPRGDVADVAFFVDDDYHAKGLGTLLLERLAKHARDHGIVGLHADVLTVNEPMLQVFRDSGLVTGVRSEGDTLSVSLGSTATDVAVGRAEERERLATAASLMPIFKPSSVAVIGASRDPGAVGRMVFDSLLRSGFNGPVFPINPAARSIGSVKAYASILDVPDQIDLAIIAVPAEQVAGLFAECATKGVRGLIVLSAGFSETGPAGKARQEELLFRARAEGMRMIGPNCIGVLNTAPNVRLNASFSPAFPPRGSIAIASQSGAIGVAILDLAREYGLGISSFASIGNRADVSTNDLLQYWEDDPETAAIVLYLESFGNPRKFSRIARRVGRRKPILAVKAGRTPAGSRAARSHTAALATDDRGVTALFRQAGIIRAETLEELFDIAAVLANQPLPSGRRVAIITNAGGPAILCADACESQGLVLASFAPETLAALQALLPESAACANPVDMIASASVDQFSTTTRLVLADPDVDALIVIHTPIGSVGATEVTAAVQNAVASARAGGATSKPVVACISAARDSWSSASVVPDSSVRLTSETIPTFQFPEPAARALAVAATYAAWRRQPLGDVPELSNVDAGAARRIVEAAVAAGEDRWLGLGDCVQLLAAADIAVAPSQLAKTPEEAARAAKDLGFPVALKIVSSRHLHKSDVGGVILGLDSPAAVSAASRVLGDRLGSDLEGYVVQRMVPGGVEVIAGATADPTFGPLIAFGLGGTAAEALNDVTLRITPLTDADAAEMVHSIRGHALLEGFRGEAPADTVAVEQLLLRLSWLVESVPEVVELDLNPVVVLAAGCGAVPLDVRIRIRR